MRQPCTCAKERVIYSAADHRNKRVTVGKSGCDICHGTGYTQPCGINQRNKKNGIRLVANARLRPFVWVTQ